MTEYIEREKLEAELNHRLSFLMAENSEYNHYVSGYYEAVDTVEKFPSAADVAPVQHGRWIASHDEFCACSICKYPVYVGWNQTNYCPNCGAKMDKEKA